MKKSIWITIFILLAMAVSVSAVAKVTISTPTGEIKEPEVEFNYAAEGISDLTKCELQLMTSSNPITWSTVKENDSAVLQYQSQIITYNGLLNNKTYNWTVSCTNSSGTQTWPDDPNSNNPFYFTINTNINYPPVFQPFTPITINEDNEPDGGSNTNHYLRSATDQDGDTITYSITETDTLKVGCSIDPSTRQLTLTPADNFNGEINCTAKADDGKTSTTKEFTIIVTARNDAPVLTATTLNVLQDSTTAKTFNLTDYMADVDESDIHSYSVDCDSSKLTCSVSSNTLSLTPVSGATGSTLINITVTDNSQDTATNSDMETFTVTFTPANPSIKVSIAPENAVLARSISTGASDTIKMELENNGNTDLSPVTITKEKLVSGEHEIPTSKITVTPSSLSLTQGEKKNVSITIQRPADNTQTSGQELTYTGNLNITYGSNSLNQEITAVLRDPKDEITFDPTEIVFDETERNVSTSVKSFQIKNTGDRSFTIRKISSSSSKNITFATSSSGTFSETIQSTTTLSKDGSKIIYVKGFIPQDEPAGSHVFAVVDVETDKLNKSLNLKLDTITMLDFEDIIAYVDNPDASKKTDSDVKDKISHSAKPLADITIKVKLKNNFPNTADSDDSRIENILITLESPDLDVEEMESDEFDIKRDSKSSYYDFEFKVPIDADEGQKEILIRAEGIDGTDTEHIIEKTIKLEINKKNKQVVISDVRIIPAAPNKCDNSAELRITVSNIGTEEEDDNWIVVNYEPLSIDYESSKFSLSSESDDDSEATQRVIFNIPKDGTSSFSVPVKLYRGSIDGTADHSRTFDFTLEECTGAQTTTATTDDTTTDDSSFDVVEDESTTATQGAADTGTGAATGGAVAQPVSSAISSARGSFKSTNAYTPLLILANIVIIGALVFAILKFFVLAPKP